MTNQIPVTLNCTFRGPGEKGEETQGGVTVSYGPDDVVVRIGNSFMRVDLEEFFMALDANDPQRNALGETVYNLQVKRTKTADDG